MSILRTGASVPATRSVPDPAGRSRRLQVAGLLAVAGLLVEAGLIELSLRHLLTRPFYYDEAWRAYEISLGAGFLAKLHAAVAPVSLGWLGIENVARLLLGNTEAGLRAPMFVGLPVLALVTYRLARCWLGVGVSFCVVGLLLANGWIVNYALQLKAYSLEGLFAIAAVALYLLVQRRPALHQAQVLGLYAALGLTCVFSLPNLFVAGPLLVLDLVEALRARHRVALRIAGEALAAAIALAHYLLFVRPQAAVADVFFRADYAPHRLAAFVRFALIGVKSYIPTMIIGVAGGARSSAAPTYVLPPAAHHVLALVLVLLLAAGVVAAVGHAAGRALVVAVGGALLLELLASAIRRWPFGLLRQNIFVLPLLYILAGIGAVWLANLLRRPRRADDGRSGHVTWWRQVGRGLAAAALAAAAFIAVAAGGVATAKAFAETLKLQSEPTWFGGTRAAVADARLVAMPGDLVIIGADRSPPAWYAGPWLYYMNWYQGYPAPVHVRPGILARNTIPVVFVTPGAVRRFLAAHPGSSGVFLLEYDHSGATFPARPHLQALETLRRYGYCPAHEITLPDTGALTVLNRAACPAPKARR